MSKEKLLGFDLLLRFDAMKKLGVVHLTKLGEVHFLTENLPMIKINEPDFSVIFDQRKEE